LAHDTFEPWSKSRLLSAIPLKRKLVEIAKNLVVDAKKVQAEHQRTLEQFGEIGGLSLVELGLPKMR
jgi:hypothetical protein